MSSVVSGKLMSDSVYAGNPVKRLRTRNPIETVRTRLYTRQGLSCVPQSPPKWNLINEDIVDIFDDLIDDGISIDKFKFLLDESFCNRMLTIDLPATIEETILMLDGKYRGKA
jgi:hypothetical protein